MKYLKWLAISGSLVLGASLYAGHKDSVNNFFASTGFYRETSRLASGASHELYKFRHRDIYESVEAELDRKIKSSDGKPVFLEIGASWCAPCQSLNAYLFGDNNTKGIAQNYPHIRFESVELDEGANDDVHTPRNDIIKDVLIERGMANDSLHLPTVFVINNGNIDTCMNGYTFGGLMKICDSDNKVNIKEKLNLVSTNMPDFEHNSFGY